MSEPAQDIVAGRRARYRQAGETRRGGLPREQLAQLAGLRLDGLARQHPAS